jgi:hypothetical protein
VHAFPRPAGAFLSPQRTTGANGEFALQLPSSAIEVDVHVRAGGFASRMFRQRVNEDPLDIHLGQNGGTLRIASSGDGVIRIRHRGAEFGAGALLGAQVRVDGEERHITIPDLEPGEYVVCREETCTMAGVAPFAIVDVRLR